MLFLVMGLVFCIFNDLAIAARVLQQLNLVHKVLIVDLDVHHETAPLSSFKTTQVSSRSRLRGQLPGIKQRVI